MVDLTKKKSKQIWKSIGHFLQLKNVMLFFKKIERKRQKKKNDGKKKQVNEDEEKKKWREKQGMK